MTHLHKYPYKVTSGFSFTYKFVKFSLHKFLQIAMIAKLALILLACLALFHPASSQLRSFNTNVQVITSNLTNHLLARASTCDAGYSPCSDGVSCCPFGDTVYE